MKRNYKEELAQLLNRAYPRPSNKYRLEFKNVFGAVGGYVNGHMFTSCGKFGVALKLPPRTLENLFNRKIAKHLKYFPNGHIKKEYAVFPKKITENTRQFRKLMNQSIQYVLKINI